MTYTSIVEMTDSVALRQRVAACAADEGWPDDPQRFAADNIWSIASSDDGWVAAWDYAKASDNATNFNPDTGARDDVINDAMILAVVQPLVQAVLNPAEPEGG